MAEALRNYQAIPDMGEQKASWTKFHVHMAGNTNGAHLAIVQFFTTMGQNEVMTPEECDYLLVFCPAVSRVGTDIREALANIPLRRPVILVVMHHTFDRQCVIAESGRQVDDPNVRLTVDCLFYEHHLLNCNLNDIMRANIQRFFGVSEVSVWGNWLQQKMVLVVITIVVIGILLIVLLAVCLQTIRSG